MPWTLRNTTLSGLWKTVEIPLGHVIPQCIALHIWFSQPTHSSPEIRIRFEKGNFQYCFIFRYYENALRCRLTGPTDYKSTLVQVMACCLTTPSHYLNKCWPRSMAPYSVTYGRHPFNPAGSPIGTRLGLCISRDVSISIAVTTRLTRRDFRARRWSYSSVGE